MIRLGLGQAKHEVMPGSVAPHEDLRLVRYDGAVHVWPNGGGVVAGWLDGDFHQAVHLLPPQAVGEAELLLIAAGLGGHLPHHLHWVLDYG